MFSSPRYFKTSWHFAEFASGFDAPGQAPYDAGVTAVQNEQLDVAIDYFIESVENNPYHREAYLLLLALLDGAGRYAEAQLYGDLAERHLPEDGLVAYRQGIASVRGGELEEAVRYFDLAARWAPALYQPHFFGAHVLLAQGGSLEGVCRRLERAVEFAEARPEVEATLVAVRRCLRSRRVLRWCAALGMGLSLVGGLLVSPVAGAVALFFSGGLGLTSGPLSAAFARLLARRCFEEPT